jgi:hypothetical protein
VDLSQPDGLGSATSFSAYGTGGFGANVGTGDIDDDGLSEALTGPGPAPSFGPHVRAFRADATPLANVSYYGYGTLRYGVRPAGGEVDGDAYDEILTAPGAGAVFGPHVRGWNFDGSAVSPITGINLFAYQTLKWGARAAGGNLDGDAFQEILTAPGPGQVFGPHIRAFNHDGGATTAIAKVNFYAFASGNHGATVSAADVESDGFGAYGDGYQEILVGRGPEPGALADFALFDYDGSTLASKAQRTAFSTLYGTTVAGGDVDAGDIEEVVTAHGADPAATARVLIWEWEPGIDAGYEGLSQLGTGDFEVFGGQTTHGANVAVGTFE